MTLLERREYTCQFEESDLTDFTLIGEIHEDEAYLCYTVEVTGGFGIDEAEWYDTLEECYARLDGLFIEIQDRMDGRV